MGTIEVDSTAGDPAQAYAVEKCIGEGGHFFYRTGERYEEGDFEVQCERCAVMGWEKPDEGDPPLETKTILPGDTDDDGPRMRMARNRRRHILSGEPWIS